MEEAIVHWTQKKGEARGERFKHKMRTVVKVLDRKQKQSVISLRIVTWRAPQFTNVYVCLKCVLCKSAIRACKLPDTTLIILKYVK
jgi:hypothetical protein